MPELVQPAMYKQHSTTVSTQTIRCTKNSTGKHPAVNITDKHTMHH